MDLGHLELEEPLQKALVGPAHEDLRAAARAADLEDVGLHVLADPVVLDGGLLGRREDRLHVVADVEDDRPRLDAVHRPGDHLAFAVRELVEDLLPLDLAEPLEDDLLRRLRTDSTEDVVLELLGLDKIAGLGVGLELAGVVDAELDERILDLIDRGLGSEHPETAGLRVDPDLDVLVARDAAIGGLDAVLHRVDQLLSGDLLLGVELEEGTDEIATHGASSLHSDHSGPTKRNVGVTHVVERPFSCAKYTRRAWRPSRPASAYGRPRPTAALRRPPGRRRDSGGRHTPRECR